jgi:hypothetical protein
VTEVTFTDAAIDDLRRIGPDAVPKVLILLDSPEAGYPLGGMAPHDVVALSLEDAVDRWGEFTSKPR